MRKFTLLLTFLLGANFLFAQENDSTQTNLYDLDLETLLEMKVVSSSKKKEKTREAPNIINLYTREQIKLNGWESVNDVLYHHAGFYPSQDYDRRTVGARGLFEGWNNNHLLLLIDGVAVNDNLYSTAYTWDITPLTFLKSLETIRGPGAALYGSSATNGVITINTISPGDVDQNIIVNAAYGERNQQRYEILGTFENNLLAFTAAYSFYKTDGIDYLSMDGAQETNADGETVFTLQRAQVPDKQNSDYIFAKIEGQKALSGLSMQYHRQNWQYETGHGWLWFIPDSEETMKESRDIVILKYQRQNNKIEQEYVARFQNHRIDWDMVYYPQQAWNGYYPHGVTEYLKTNASDLLLRAQYSIGLPAGSNLLFGVEPTVFSYTGDQEHYSNTDLNDAGGFQMDDGTDVPPNEGWWAPYPNGENRDMGPWLEYIENQPLVNLGSFLQYSSGQLLGDNFRFNIGLRYDNQFFNYYDINLPDKPLKSKTFDRLSPRLALIYLPNSRFSAKLLSGTAFRAPAPTEMFGSNTWTLASNLAELTAENILTNELAFSYKFTKNLGINLNTYYTISEGQIAYSIANNNLSTNVYDLSNMGLEMEINYKYQQVGGFLNLSYVQRMDEKIFTGELAYISLHADKVTWVPALTANMGVNFQNKSWSAAILAHYQGKVERRDLDLFTADDLDLYGLTDLPRQEAVAAWTSVNAKISYKMKQIDVGVSATNLLNTENHLAKNLKYPFDYRMEGRRISGHIALRF